MKNIKKEHIIIGIVCVAILIIYLVFFMSRPKANLNTTIEDLQITDVKIQNDGYLLTGTIENKGSKVGGVNLKASVYKDDEIITILHLITYFNDDFKGNFNATTSIEIKDIYTIKYEITEFFD